MKYYHLFFDLDHTLWDFETNAKETILDLYEMNQLNAKGIHDFDLFVERYSFHNERALGTLYKRSYKTGRTKMEKNVADFTGF